MFGTSASRRLSPQALHRGHNVQNLRVVWRWASADRDFQIADPALRATRNEDTPLMVKGVLSTVTPLGMVAALDPATSQQRWLYDARRTVDKLCGPTTPHCRQRRHSRQRDPRPYAHEGDASGLRSGA